MEWSPAPMGLWTGSQSTAKNLHGLVGFCHGDLTYHDRITGCYDGGCYGDGIDVSRAIQRLWSEACNRIQWKARGERFSARSTHERAMQIYLGDREGTQK